MKYPVGCEVQVRDKRDGELAIPFAMVQGHKVEAGSHWTLVVEIAARGGALREFRVWVPTVCVELPGDEQHDDEANLIAQWSVEGFTP